MRIQAAWIPKLVFLGQDSIFTKYFLNCQFTEGENTAELKTSKGRCSSCDRVRELISNPLNVGAADGARHAAEPLPQPHSGSRGARGAAGGATAWAATGRGSGSLLQASNSDNKTDLGVVLCLISSTPKAFSKECLWTHLSKGISSLSKACGRAKFPKMLHVI